MEKTLKVLIYTALVSVVFVFESVFFPYIDSKILIFEGGTLLAGLAWVYLWYKHPNRYSPQITWLTIAIASFIGVSIVAALAGVNFWRSFWSTFERLDGIFTWISFFLFSIILTSVYRKREDWLSLFRASLAISIAVGLRAIVVSMDGAFTLPTHLSAVFNSPIYLGVYALFHIVIALYLLYSLDIPVKGLKDLTLYIRGIWSLLYTFGFVLNLLVLFLTFSRGPILGFFAGLVVFIFWYLIEGREKAALGKFLAIAFVVLAVTFPFWKNSDLLARLSTITKGLGADETRSINWHVAAKAFARRPLLGWGSNNYFVAQNEFYNPRLQSLIKESFDRTHNKYLEVAVDSGVLGILAYASIFILLYRQLLKHRSKEPFLTGLLAGLFSAYLTQNITAFDNPGSYLPLFFFFGFITTTFFTPLQKEWRLSPIVAIMFFIIILGFFWRGVVRPFEANVSLAYAVGDERNNPRDYQTILTRYQEALSYQTLGDYEIRIQLGTFVINAPEVSKELLDLALREFQKESAISTRDVFLHIALAKLYDRAGFLEKRPELLANAEETYKKAIDLSPSRADSYQHYAIFLINQGRGKDARDILSKINDINSDIYQSDRTQWYRAMSYFADKDFVQAYQGFQNVLSRNKGYGGQQELLALAKTTFELKKYQEMLHWYEELYRADTENPQYNIFLAAAYKQVGDKVHAIEFAKRAVRLNPGLAKEAGEFTKSLR